jgi:hypothetical protein
MKTKIEMSRQPAKAIAAGARLISILVLTFKINIRCN